MKLRGGHSHSLPIKIAVAERGVDEDRVESVELDGEWADVLLPLAASPQADWYSLGD